MAYSPRIRDLRAQIQANAEFLWAEHIEDIHIVTIAARFPSPSSNGNSTQDDTSTNRNIYGINGQRSEGGDGDGGGTDNHDAHASWMAFIVDRDRSEVLVASHLGRPHLSITKALESLLATMSENISERMYEHQEERMAS